jgi:hypothetical protein
LEEGDAEADHRQRRGDQQPGGHGEVVHAVEVAGLGLAAANLRDQQGMPAAEDQRADDRAEHGRQRAAAGGDGGGPGDRGGHRSHQDGQQQPGRHPAGLLDELLGHAAGGGDGQQQRKRPGDRGRRRERDPPPGRRRHATRRQADHGSAGVDAGSASGDPASSSHRHQRSSTSPTTVPATTNSTVRAWNPWTFVNVAITGDSGWPGSTAASTTTPRPASPAATVHAASRRRDEPAGSCVSSATGRMVPLT